MSSIYQPHQGQGQTLASQLKSTLGLQKVLLGLTSGLLLEGVIGEMGEDYCLLIEAKESERWVRLAAIEWVKIMPA